MSQGNALRVIPGLLPFYGVLESLKHYFDRAIAAPFERIRSDTTSVLANFNSFVRLKMHRDCTDHLPTPEECDRASAQLILSALCVALGIPGNRGEHAYLALFGDILPHRAPAIWSKRAPSDAQLTPLQFYQKHWGRYVEEGNELLYQVDLRALDPSLFEAIKIHVRRHLKGQDPKDYLPPPYQSRIARRCDEPDLSLFATLDTPLSEASPARRDQRSRAARPTSGRPSP